LSEVFVSARARNGRVATLVVFWTTGVIDLGVHASVYMIALAANCLVIVQSDDPTVERMVEPLWSTWRSTSSAKDPAASSHARRNADPSRTTY